MKFIYSLIAIMSIVLFVSCNTDELCYQHPHDGEITITYDWSDLPEAHPEGMRLWLYPSANPSPGIYDLPADGGLITNILTGHYSIATHNNDLDVVSLYNSYEYGSHVAITNECDVLAPMYGPGMRSTGIRADGDERVFACAEPMWAASVDGIDIKSGDNIVLKPQPYTCHYTFEFRNVGSVNHISSVSASISGMSPGVRLSDGSLLTEPCTLALKAFVGNQRSTENSIVGEFYTFGHHENVAAPHRMALYVVLDTGQKIKYTTGDNLDVTEQIHNASDHRNVHIVVDDIDIPEPITNGGGFGPGVDDWGVVNIIIPM